MELQYEFTMHPTLGARHVIGAGPFGGRVVAGVSGGWVRGERVNGTVVGPGADWALATGDGYAHVDVRLQIVTDDQATIFVVYTGLLEVNDAVSAALTSDERETSWDDQYFRVEPRFECGAERYSWIHRSLFVARGRIATDGVEYEVYRVC